MYSKRPYKSAAEFSRKWPKRGRIFKMFCFLSFFHMKHEKHGIFIYFGTDMVTQIYSYFDELKDAIFTKRLNFYPAAEFLSPLPQNFGKSWQHLLFIHR
jgi:hypothetical protein